MDPHKVSCALGDVRGTQHAAGLAAYDGPSSMPARRHATSPDMLEAASDPMGVHILRQPEAKSYDDGPSSVPARRRAASPDMLEAVNDLTGVNKIALEAEAVSEAAQAVVDMLQSVRIGVVVLRGPVLEVLVGLFQHHLRTENEVWSWVEDKLKLSLFETISIYLLLGCPLVGVFSSFCCASGCVGY